MSSTKSSSPDPSGQKRIVPFDRKRHAGLGVDTARCKQFAQSLNTVYLNVVEFFYANRFYPVVFVTDGDKGFLPCAVTGLEQGENLFIDADGNWQQGFYIPAQVRMYPVYVSAASANKGTDDDKRIVLVDETGLVKSTEPFFTRIAEPTGKWKLTEKLVSDYISAEKLTRKFTARVASLGLLEPFDAQINPTRAAPKRLTGLYRVNEDRLNSLPAKDIKSLMKGGELSRIYAHLISLENFSGLLDRSAAAGAQKQR